MTTPIAARMRLPGPLKQAARAFPLDWTARRRHRLFERAPELGSYYIRWSGGYDPLGEEWDAGPFDRAGVLLNAGGLYHQTRIAQYALEKHAQWVEHGDRDALHAFLVQARWLKENQVTRGGVVGTYPAPFPWPTYGAQAGFLSGMTQGEAISVLLRAYEELSDAQYLRAAESAATAFAHDIGEGGVRFVHGNDVYYEEAAALPASHILNGWIYALWGLFELSLRSRLTWVEQAYGESLETLARQLHRYDSGRWSYYSMLATRSGFRKLATLKYHTFHIAQLEVLSSMSNRPQFHGEAARWERYVDDAGSRLQVWLNAAWSLPMHLVTHADTVPGGAKCIV